MRLPALYFSTIFFRYDTELIKRMHLHSSVELSVAVRGIQLCVSLSLVSSYRMGKYGIDLLWGRILVT